MYEWPGLYTLVAGNPFGRFNDTLNDVLSSLKNAKERAPDYAAQHAVGDCRMIPRCRPTVGRVAHGGAVGLCPGGFHRRVAGHGGGETILIVSVETADTPRVPANERAIVTRVEPSVFQVQLEFGFMDSPTFRQPSL